MSTTPAAKPFEPKQSSADTFSPDKRLTDIKQLYEASKKYRQENYDDEFAEAYRAVKVRIEPVMIEDAKGNMVEDTNRTNVCMPGLNTIVKRKTARKTANPPTLNYYVPNADDSMLAQRLTARAYYEYDRSGEAYEFKRGVNQADIFGLTYWKHFYDTVEIQQQMRYEVASLTNRRNLLKAQGAGDDQIQEAIAKQGEDVSQQELADMIAQHGPEIRGTSPFIQYEGPVTKCRFIGDIFIEPGCLTLNASSYVIEKYTETDLWLRKMAKKTYKDPDSGADVPIFDSEKVQELWDKKGELSQERVDDLRKVFRASIGKAEPMVEQRLLPGKRFEITEFHGPDKEGQMWIEYIGNDSVYLGRQPYPFDLGGKFLYTEYVPWPDIIGAIGDSSPRALRFLHAMHNANAGQIIDVVNQYLCKAYKVSSVADIPDQVRNGFGRFFIMRGGDMNSVLPFQDTGVGPDAYQASALIKTEMRENEPALGGVDAVGTDFNPEASRTATTAILSAKSSDVLMQSEIDSLNLTIGDQANIKLQIHRQLSDTINVPNRARYTSKIQGLTERFGKTSMITIKSVPELQGQDGEFIEVEAVAGSTLAVDDELRATKIQQVYAMAEQDPVTWNKHEAGKLVLTTIKGVGDTSQLLNDPAQQRPPGPKVSVSVTLPLDKAANVPADILNQALAEFGLQPSADVAHKQSIDALIHASAGADAVVNLASPAHTPKDAQAGILKGQQTKIQDKINAAP